MKKFNDYFKIENVIRILSEFNVVLGGFYFGQPNYLEENTNGKHGRLLYQEFLKKYYYSYFKKYPELKEFYSKPDVRLIYQTGQLAIIFDYIGFMSDIINGLKFIPEQEKRTFFNRFVTYDPEKFSYTIIHYLKLEKELYKKSLNSNASLALLGIKKQDKPGLVTPYEQKINKMISMVNDTLKLFTTTIEPEELFRCFDYDKLCFMLGKSLLDEENGALRHQGKLCKQMHVLSHYVNCVWKYLKENPKYFPKITIKGKVYDYTHLLQGYRLLVDKDSTYSEDYFEDIIADESFPWEILAPGNKLIPGEKGNENISHTVKCTDVDTYEARKVRVIEGFNYLISLNPIKTFKGIGKFEGYIGFEYSNGIVIFEKAYEADGSVAIGNATYIMNRNNFKRLSQLTKTQIMFILKQSKVGVQRLYHTENMKSWKTTIKSLISDSDYTPSDYDYIDELIQLRNLEKSKIKK